MFRIAGYTAAATVLLSLGVWFFVIDHGRQIAFAGVLENVTKAESMSFVLVQKFGDLPEINGKFFFQGDRIRIEQYDGQLVQIADLKLKKTLALIVPRKIYQQTKLDQEVAAQFANPLDGLRKAKPENVEKVGEEELNGIRTLVYRTDKVDMLLFEGKAETKFWIDPNTDLPVKIVIQDRNPKSPTLLRLEQFSWNKPLDEELFKLDVPAGYTAGKVLGPGPGQ